MRRRRHPALGVHCAGTLAAVALLFASTPVEAQQNPDARVERIEIRPAGLELAVGERAPIEVVALDAAGNPVKGAQVTLWTQGAEIAVDPTHREVEGVAVGRTAVLARVRRLSSGQIGFQDVWGRATVTVHPAPITRIELIEAPARLYAGTRSRLAARAYTGAGPRDDVTMEWRSSAPEIVEVGAGGAIRAGRTGRARVTVATDGIEASLELAVVPNPIRRLVVRPRRIETRVGEVVRLDAEALDADGRAVAGAPIDWSWEALAGQPYDAIWLESEDPGTAALVANEPGLYRLTASVGGTWADAELVARARPLRREVRRIAHGVVPQGQATTDLWVFEGRDGQDYAYTGTYSGNLMYAWDVTEPARPVITDSVYFDGRRVNDVKVNADRSLAVVTSEHASDRRNGITVLDLADPAHPQKVSHYAEGLSGGVHNTWIEGDLVYAVHYGTRALHIIDISDSARPHEVGRWQLQSEDRFLHDVTIEDGLAYLSYWNDGLVILDVGAGIAGGTPTEPTLVSQYEYSYRLGAEAYGNTHHAIRYGDYVFTGDEIFGCSECINGPRGYIHVIDVSDIENPREVAYYRVPEAGSHNMWAEDGKLYIGYYQGGLRIVDIDGELRGDLYRQGREIGWYMTEDPEGTRPNSTDTWGAQPFKGKIFASDGSSGLWILELSEPPAALVP